MSDEILMEIIEKVDLLTPEERGRLVSAMAERDLIPAAETSESSVKWLDLIGMLSYPACGEDAQTHISKSRREAGEKRLAF
ncbi:MAG: hypothetical protein V2B18_16585 [Pseudomonadota bacterium]